MYRDAFVSNASAPSRRSFLKAVGMMGVAAAATALGCGGLSGCGLVAASAKPTAVALVVDKGANSARAGGVSQCVYEVLKPVVAEGGYFVLDVVSGKPSLVCSMAVSRAGNPTALAQQKRWEKDAAFEAARNLDSQLPAAEEVDLLEALKQAARELDAAEAKTCDTRTIYVAAPGLQTAGVLDMTGRGRYGDVLDGWDYQVLLDRIAEDSSSGDIRAEALPNLEGVHVVFMGLGDLADGAQCDIPVDKIAKLKDLWCHVVRYCGGEIDAASDFLSCTVDDGSSVPDRSALPYVTPVVWADSLACSVITFDENVLEFATNDDVYKRDPVYVEAILAPYAESLKATGTSVVILGTTADDGSGRASCRDLGMRRANRVKDDLAAMGVDPDKMTIASAGYEGVNIRIGDEVVDLYHSNYFADGSWDESTARRNRAVSIVNASLADDILSRFGVS